jgi:hypothetical protein
MRHLSPSVRIRYANAPPGHAALDRRSDGRHDLADQRDPPGESVPPRLLDLRRVEGQQRRRVGERAYVGERALARC